ncbi:unnamed protein product [Calypogeia fissa]
MIDGLCRLFDFSMELALFCCSQSITAAVSMILRIYGVGSCKKNMDDSMLTVGFECDKDGCSCASCSNCAPSCSCTSCSSSH